MITSIPIGAPAKPLLFHLETLRELLGIESDEYPLFPELNRTVLKPAIKEINALTDYHVEVEQKRVGRKVAELKFRITRVKQLPVQESLFPDIENLPPVAIELLQAHVDRKVARQIAKKAWSSSPPQSCHPPTHTPIFSPTSPRRLRCRFLRRRCQESGRLRHRSHPRKLSR